MDQAVDMPAMRATDLRSDATSQDIAAGDWLAFPLHRRAVLQSLAVEGRPARRIFYDDKEILFEESELFGFAETLVRQPRFRAGDALGWAEALDWPRLQGMLRDLVAHGVLVPAADLADDGRAAGGEVPAPLPPGPCAAPRSWQDCPAITAELTGRAVDLGHLELVVPIFRIAHIALDADGRQVGEANVFPPALRLDTPTEWRTCLLPGSRYRSDRPMNVTAMRVMRTHWAQMMAAIGAIRSAYLRRFPDAEAGWTVGHVERLAVAVLAVPTYRLMRDDAVLHPALSSLFRVTDGVRMVMHQMLFVPIGEPARSPDDPVDADDILDYAERNYSFHSPHGVCAGPRAMVRELIVTLLDGPAGAAPLDPAVQAALDDVDAALDYALLGLQAHAAVFSIWPVAARCYAQLAALAEGWGDAAPALRAALAGHATTLTGATYLGHERWRAGREDVYTDMFARCGAAVRGAAPPAPLPDLLRIDLAQPDAAALCDRLAQHLRDAQGLPAPQAQDAADTIAAALLRIRAALAAAVPVQARINALLGRTAPAHLPTAADIDVHNRMQPPTPHRLPFLPEELSRLLGLEITLDAARCDIVAAPSAPVSAGAVAGGPACPWHAAMES